MFSKTIFAAAFVALSSFATAASPPGCLLGAVNEYKSPGDISAVCKADDVKDKVQEFCGDDTEAALEALADVCGDADVDVSTDLPSSTSSSGSSGSSGSMTATPSMTMSMTGTGSHASGTGYPGSGYGNGTSVATGTPVPTNGQGAGSTTGSGDGPESTGAAGKLELGAAVVLAGLMAVAL